MHHYLAAYRWLATRTVRRRRDRAPGQARQPGVAARQDARDAARRAGPTPRSATCRWSTRSWSTTPARAPRPSAARTPRSSTTSSRRWPAPRPTATSPGSSSCSTSTRTSPRWTRRSCRRIRAADLDADRRPRSSTTTWAWTTGPTTTASTSSSCTSTAGSARSRTCRSATACTCSARRRRRASGSTSCSRCCAPARCGAASRASPACARRSACPRTPPVDEVEGLRTPRRRHGTAGWPDAADVVAEVARPATGATTCRLAEIPRPDVDSRSDDARVRTTRSSGCCGSRPRR